MLRKFNTTRSLNDNIGLGSITAFSAGMVNVASLIIFLAFASNVTGHYAILAEELSRSHWYQTLVVIMWIFLFFLGSFTSNFIVIHASSKGRFVAHSIPIFLEILVLLGIGFYCEMYYSERLLETEILVSATSFAMGLQNGLTATITNFLIKTTHLTGLTTDIGILTSMLTKKQFRRRKSLRQRLKLSIIIMCSYLTGGIISAFIVHEIGTRVFFVASFVLLCVLIYDLYVIIMRLSRLARIQRGRKSTDLSDDPEFFPEKP